jgi:uncharacterized protein YdaU (DUF1376 family)
LSIIHIPFYPSDWLGGTRSMSDAETGVYITLIATMYEMAAPIERNDDRLYRVCGSKSKASFVKSLNYLMSEGKIIETDDGLFNEKVSKVIQQTIEKSDKAKAAAQSRWDRKPSKNKGAGDADAYGTHMPEGCQLELEPELYTNTSVFVSEPDKPDKPKVAAKRATAIPENWVPSERNIQDAIDRQFSEKEISNEADQFRDYNLSKGNRYKDWDAAWRTWLGNSRKFSANRGLAGKANGSGHGRGRSIASIVAQRRLDG